MSTLTTEQHLDRILAKCKALLETARKRTPGKWEVQPHKSWHKEFTVGPVIIDYDDVDHNEQDANAAFIAACAGSAEAGWQATIQTIEQWKSLYVYADGFADGAPDASAHDKLCNEVASLAKAAIQSIIAAWPEELLA